MTTASWPATSTGCRRPWTLARSPRHPGATPSSWHRRWEYSSPMSEPHYETLWYFSSALCQYPGSASESYDEPSSDPPLKNCVTASSLKSTAAVDWLLKKPMHFLSQHLNRGLKAHFLCMPCAGLRGYVHDMNPATPALFPLMVSCDSMSVSKPRNQAL